MRAATVALAAVALVPHPLAQNKMLFPAERLEWGEPPFAVGDLDLDGTLDIVTYARTCDSSFTSCWQGVFVRLGRPGRKFSEPQFHQAGSQAWEFPPPAADMMIRELTGDGWPDIAFLDTKAREIVVLPSIGPVAFGAPVGSNCTETLDAISGMDLVDLDPDGILDAVVTVKGASSCKCVQLLRGSGSGSFDPTVTYSMGGQVSQPKVRDVNADGLLDLVALKGTTQVVVRLGNPGGGYADPVSTTSPQPLSTLEMIDIDADGLLDIISGSFSLPDSVSSSVALLRNLGGGAFELVGSISLQSVWPYGTFPAVAVADMNGDSLSDIIAGTRAIYSIPEKLADDALFLIEGHGGFSFAPPSELAASGTNAFASLVPADLDADGHMDLVYAAEGSAPFGVRYGAAGGGLDVGRTVDTPSPAIDIASGDINGDGHADVVLAHPSGSPGLTALLGGGTGSFSPGPSIPFPDPVHRVLLSDVSADGILDLVTASPTTGQTVQVHFGLGDGAFQMPSIVSDEPAADLEIADVDGDGLADVLSCDPLAQRVNVHQGQGQGVFAAPVGYPSGGPSRRLSVGDLDEDGYVDVLLANLAQWTMSTLHNEAGIHFGAPVVYESLGTQDLAVGDYDRDGHQDAVLALYGEFDYGSSTLILGGIVCRPGLGDGLLDDSVSLGGDAAGRVEIADLNRDGWPDVVAATVPGDALGPDFGVLEDEDLLHVALGQDRSLGTWQGFSVQAGLRPVATTVADFNEDGFPDIAAAQSETASITILLNQSKIWASLGHDLAPASGGATPLLTASGTPLADAMIKLEASSPLLQGGEPGLLVAGFDTDYLPFQDGVLVPAAHTQAPMRAGAPLVTRWPKHIAAGTPVYVQALFALAGGELIASNALVVIAQ